MQQRKAVRSTGRRIGLQSASAFFYAHQSTGWVLAVTGEYHRADGTLIGRTNAARVFVFPLTNAVQTTSVNIRTGAIVVDANTWSVSSTTCTDWTSNAGLGESGNSDAVSSAMISNTGTPTACGGPVPIYCVQQ